MNKAKAERIIRIDIYLFIAAAAAVICYTIVSFSKPYMKQAFFNSGEIMDWSSSWNYSDSSGKQTKIDLPMRDGGVSDVDYVMTEKILPSQIEPGWYLVLYSSFQKMQVYIGGQLVEDYEGNESLFSTRIPANKQIFVPLKQEYAGQEVKIRIETLLPNYKESLNEVRIGTKSAVLYSSLFKSMFTVVCGSVIIIFGMVLFMMNIVHPGNRHEENVYAYAGSTMIILGIWFTIQACVSQIIFDDMAASHFLELSMLLILSIPLLRYVNYIIKHKFQKLTDLLCSCFLVIVIFSLFYCLVLRRDLMEVLFLTHIMILLAVIIVSCTFWWTVFRDRELFQELKWIEIAFGCLCIGSVVEVIQFYLMPSKETGVSLAISAIAYCFCTILWAVGNNQSETIKQENAMQQSKAKSMFLANMSHEIRTPINAILGMDTLIMKKTDQPQVRKYAENLMESGRKLLALINNILEFSRIESGNMRVNDEETDTKQLIVHAARSAEHCSKNEGVIFEMSNDPDMPASFICDSEKIEQIVDNLLENAFRYTEKGTVKVSWNAEKMSKSKKYDLVINVSDTGKGIQPEYLEYIFDPFHRTQKAEGAGLGLAIVRRLAYMMNGSVDVSSKEGSGTTFTVRIPFRSDSQCTVGKVSTDQCDDETEYGFTALRARILVADDEPMNLKVITGMLKDTRIYIDAVSSGESVLEKICTGKYQMIFLDYLMPGMNGVELFGKMKRISKESGNLNLYTPIIMMTADNAPETRDMILQSGFTDFLGKPVTEAEMKNMILKYLPQEMVCRIPKGGT